MFGIGEGADDSETFSYTKFAQGLDISSLLHNINININNPKRTNFSGMNINIK